jgi:hypothetical protein
MSCAADFTSLQLFYWLLSISTIYLCIDILYIKSLQHASAFWPLSCIVPLTYLFFSLHWPVFTWFHISNFCFSLKHYIWWYVTSFGNKLHRILKDFLHFGNVCWNGRPTICSGFVQNQILYSKLQLQTKGQELCLLLCTSFVYS